MTVFIDANIESKLKGDAAAKDPDDLCMAGSVWRNDSETLSSSTTVS